ncbi:hypothetical protein ACIQFP_26725 [Nocardiopsis alba]|uniref:hypothetical protein n=1 Tax=Nocardiopsis alba TaxID=53437 RepID=UPI00382DB53E
MSDTTTPSPTVIVRLIGGPDDWRDRTLTHVTADELTGPRESLGSYLISSCVPHGHPDPGARAVYEPNADPWPITTWFFRGWFPYGPHDLESRFSGRGVPVDVETDDGLPTGWVTDEGERHNVERILAHWQANPENDLAADVWHVASDDGSDYELLSHPGHWEAGQLPAVEAQEHDDLLI